MLRLNDDFESISKEDFIDLCSKYCIKQTRDNFQNVYTYTFQELPPTLTLQEPIDEAIEVYNWINDRLDTSLVKTTQNKLKRLGDILHKIRGEQ